MGVALSLPRAGALTDELLSPVPALRPEDQQALRDKIVTALSDLAGEIPNGERLVLDRFRLDTARRRPERCAEPEPGFTLSPATCRRAVGVAAVDRLVRRRAAGPVQAVAQVLEAGAEDAVLAARGEAPRAPWWASWYAELGPGGRAVVAAEAVTWATQLWTALAWERFPSPPVVGGNDDWWDVPGCRTLTLKGRAEVRARVDSRSVLVVVGGGLPDAGHRVDLLFPALVAVVAGGTRALPGRVLGLWPASGQVRVVPVEPVGLAECADEVVSAAATWVDGLLERARPRPAAPAATPAAAAAAAG